MSSPATDLPDEREAIDDFVRAANAFCRVVERRDWEVVPLFAQAARETLTRAYAAAAALPASSAESDDPGTSSDAERSGEIEKRIATLLDAADVYQRIDDDGQAALGFVSLDLAHVWGDVARAVTAIEAGNADAVQEAQFAFEIHWGAHAASALVPLHALARRS